MVQCVLRSKVLGFGCVNLWGPQGLFFSGRWLVGFTGRPTSVVSSLVPSCSHTFVESLFGLLYLIGVGVV